MNKRIIVCFLAIAVFLTIFAGTALAGDAISFDMETGSSGIVIGESFTIEIIGKNIEDMYAYEINLSFDDGLLEFKNIETDIQGFVIPSQKKGNKIKFALAKMGNQPPENGEVTFCAVIFKSRAEGKATVSLDSVKLMDELLAEEEYTVGETVTIDISRGAGTPTVPVSTPTVIPTPTPSPTPITSPTHTPTPGDSGGNGGTAPVLSPTLSPGGNGSINPAPTKTAGSILEGAITVVAAPGEDGSTVANVNRDDFSSAAGIESGGIINIIVQAPEGANLTKINLPAGGISALEAGKTVKVQTGLASVSISADFLKGFITDDSTSVQLSVSIADAAELPQNVQSMAGNNPVYDFSLSLDGKAISDFKGKNVVEVEVDYILKPGEEPGKIVIYYIDKTGMLVKVKNGVYDPATGKVKFKPVHFSQYIAAYTDASFIDIGGVTWAKAGIEALAARGVVNGVGGSAFNPEGNVTRAEFIKMLMEAFELVDETAESGFGDMAKGTWYYGSVASAEKLGIVKGKGDGSFGVNDRISREDMSAMAYRTALLLKAGFEGEVGGAEAETFADKAQISSYAIKAVEAMQKAGIINGVGGGRFAPKEGSTRAQAAVMVYRLFCLYRLL